MHGNRFTFPVIDLNIHQAEACPPRVIETQEMQNTNRALFSSTVTHVESASLADLVSVEVTNQTRGNTVTMTLGPAARSF